MKKVLYITSIFAAIVLIAVLIWWIFSSNNSKILFSIGEIHVTDDVVYRIAVYCCFLGLGSTLYFEIKQPNSLIENILKTVTIPILYLGLFLFFLPPVFFPLFNALLGVATWTYLLNFILFTLIAISLCVSLLSYIAIIYILHHTQAYHYLPFLRILSLTTTYIFLGLLTMATIDLLRNPIAKNEILNEKGFRDIPGAFFILLIILFLIVFMFNEFRFIVYDKKHYLLYLRSFKFDEIEHTIAEPLEIVGIPILKIGNPKTFFPKGLGDVFYLPSVEWKKQLNYYINRAEYVFSVVDVTEGVLWEMFEHLEQHNKFVYHITDKEHLRIILSNVPKQEYKESFLMKCFETILNNPDIQSCSIHIKDGTCYYSDAKTILRLISGQTSMSGIPHFYIENWTSLSARVGEVTAKHNDYKLLDTTRRIIRIFRWTMSTIAQIIVEVVGRIFIFLIKLLLIFTPICVFMPNAVFIWAGVEPWGINRRVTALLFFVFFVYLNRKH